MSAIVSAQVYLRENDGDVDAFNNGRHLNLRIGQAFFNALNSNDRWILNNSSFDPYESNKDYSVKAAIEFLRSFGAS